MNAGNESTTKTDYSNEIVRREPVEGTPFTLICQQSGEPLEGEEQVTQYFGTLGKYRITETKEQREKILEELQQFSWDMVLKILAVIVPNEIERILTEISNANKELNEENETGDEAKSYQQRQ